jgi:hypothetical protein
MNPAQIPRHTSFQDDEAEFLEPMSICRRSGGRKESRFLARIGLSKGDPFPLQQNGLGRSFSTTARRETTGNVFTRSRSSLALRCQS